jgi:hypothetical protein
MSFRADEAMVVWVEYFDFVRSFIAKDLTDGLYFLHLDDGCRSSVLKLRYIEGTSKKLWNAIRVNPEQPGVSIEFLFNNFQDLPAMFAVKDKQITGLLGSLVFPFEIKELESLI